MVLLSRTSKLLRPNCSIMCISRFRFNQTSKVYRGLAGCWLLHVKTGSHFAVVVGDGPRKRLEVQTPAARHNGGAVDATPGTGTSGQTSMSSLVLAGGWAAFPELNVG